MQPIQQSNAGGRAEALGGVVALLLLGLAVRLIGAYSRFLNPDECMHYLYSLQPSFLATYEASLHTAHPPLLIIFLHYWGMFSNNELFLRLPSVFAGTLAGWFLYAWLRRIADSDTAFTAIALFLFSPALIYLSFEVRQYALLLMFISAALYLFDRAVIEQSSILMCVSILALYLALITHYSALIVALCAGVYACLRLTTVRPRVSTILIWAAGQIGALALAVFFWKSHITHIREIGMVQ